MDRLFSALGHPIRLQALERLVTVGPETQEEIRRELEVGKHLMSSSIRRLVEEGMIRRDGRGPFSVVSPNATRQLLIAGRDLEEELLVREEEEVKGQLRSTRERKRALRKAQMREGAEGQRSPSTEPARRDHDVGA